MKHTKTETRIQFFPIYFLNPCFSGESQLLALYNHSFGTNFD